MVTCCMINCSVIVVTGLSSQLTAIGIFILLHECVIPEQIHCHSTGEATWKAPSSPTNQSTLKIHNQTQGLLKWDTASVFAVSKAQGSCREALRRLGWILPACTSRGLESAGSWTGYPSHVYQAANAGKQEGRRAKQSMGKHRGENKK